MLRRWPLLLILAAVGWGLYLAGTSDGKPSAVPNGAEERVDTETTRQAPPRAGHTRPSPTSDPAGARPIPDGPSGPTAIEKADDEPLSYDPAVARVQQRFDREAGREGFAIKREAVLKNTFDRVDIHEGQLEDLECRSRTCRVRFTFTNEEAQKANTRLFQEGRRVLGPDIKFTRRDLPDGRRRVVMWATSRHGN
ncbi:MAG: hypothetical protein OXU20_05360 [Myxococcales bacterium]|nr:hypothetical protein [Myxococcales bacterium]